MIEGVLASQLTLLGEALWDLRLIYRNSTQETTHLLTEKFKATCSVKTESRFEFWLPLG